MCREDAMECDGCSNTGWEPWREEGRLRRNPKAVWVQTTERNRQAGEFRFYELTPQRTAPPLIETAKLADFFPVVPAI